MAVEKFNALVVDQVEEQHVFEKREITVEDLHAGDVLIKVAYSSLNYKDMLAASPKGGVIRSYPMIPGIDLSGEVVEDASGTFKSGDKVLITGYGTGVSHTGGLSEYARVPHEWVVSLPSGLTLQQSMIAGTAGFTAALAVLALVDHGMKVENNPTILVTGASGGVGSIALQILRAMGFKNIVALIRKPYQEEIVKASGATEVLDSTELFIKENPLLLKERFDYVIDNVGGDVAAQVIAQVRYGGSMAFCGNAGGIKLNTTVLPLILRGVNLLGIDSVSAPMAKRELIWNKFATEWNFLSESTFDEISLDKVSATMQDLKEGKHLGRTVVKVQ